MNDPRQDTDVVVEHDDGGTGVLLGVHGRVGDPAGFGQELQGALGPRN
ncbi:hypothetical protein [Rhodococcus sp. NPDC059234]